MINSKYISIGVVVAVLISLAAFFQAGPGSVGPQGPQGPSGQTVGALSSPDIASPYFSFGGVRSWGYSMPFQDATSTICTFQSPAATSSLEFASIEITTATSTASFFEIAQSRDRAATTTSIQKISVPTTELLDWVSTSTGGVVGTTIFGPNRFLNVKVGGFIIHAGDGLLEGQCKAVFVTLPDNF